jgi:receptor expression-enhancing protein 5/6
MAKTKKIKTESLVKKIKEQIQLIQEKTGINGYVFIGLIILSLIFVYFNLFENLITNLIGTVYPTFWTIKSIESKDGKAIHWLIYWIIFSSFILLDFFSGFVVKIIPFYFVMKICFLIWLQWPESKGCDIIFSYVINNIFESIEEELDEYVQEVKDVSNDYVFNEKNKQKIMGITKALKNFKNMVSFSEDKENEKIVKNE